MSKYASGEEPRVGDVVRVLEGEASCLHGIKEGTLYTVNRADGNYINIDSLPNCMDYPNCYFRLIRRADPASPWIPGPPPETCLNAMVCDPAINGERPFVDHRGFHCDGWPARITHHIPIDIPAAPVEPLKLPRRFRAKRDGFDCVGVEFQGGDRTWEQRGADGRYNEVADSGFGTVLTEIEFVDPE